MNIKTDTDREIVLVVDDTAANHEVIREFLKDIDILCESAFDGMEAVTLCSTLPKDYYSLILMDLNLPRRNGAEAAADLRSMGITAPIIAVTAAHKEEVRLINACNHFDHLLYKPFNAAEFFAALKPFIKGAAPEPLKKKPDAVAAAAVQTGRLLQAEEVTQTEGGLPFVDVQICDVEKAIGNMGSNPKLFMKHFNNFKRNHVDLALRMRVLIDEREYAECALLCHSIKGLSGMLGLTRLYEHVVQMEALLHEELLSQEDKPFQEETLLRQGISDCITEKDRSVPGAIYTLLTRIGTDIRQVCQVQI